MNDLVDFVFNHKNEHPNKRLFVGICTTSLSGRKIKNCYTSFPKKTYMGNFYIHFVVFTNKDAIDLINKTKSIVDLFFIDIENKNKSFDYKNIISCTKIKNLFPIEPNNITTNGILFNIHKFNPKDILVIGSGNLAFSICNRLKFNNFNFKWSVDKNRKSKSIIKMNSFFCSEFLNIKKFHFSMIINTIPSDFDFNKCIKKDTIFLEVSGFSLKYLKTLNCKKQRFDITDFISSEVEKVFFLYNKEFFTGRKKINDFYICSGGYIGNENDIIVDNYISPTYVIGICDGFGGFKTRLNVKFDKYISLISNSS